MTSQHPDPVWDLVEAGRYEEARHLHHERGLEYMRPEWRFLVREGDLLCCIGLFKEAVLAFRKADKMASEETPGFRLLTSIAVAEWLASDTDNAIQTLESCISGIESGRISYTDGIRGGDVALLSFAFAVLEEKTEFRARALDFMTSLLNPAVLAFWPVPLCRFALGLIDFPELLESASGRKKLNAAVARSRNDLLTRRHVAKALFYSGIRCHQDGDKAKARNLFEKCVELNCPIDREWVLARALSQ